MLPKAPALIASNDVSVICVDFILHVAVKDSLRLEDIQHLRRLGSGLSQRLAKQTLVRLSPGDDCLGVEVVGQSDNHDIALGIADCALQVAGPARDIHFLHDLLGVLGRSGVVQIDRVHVRMLLQRSGGERSYKATAKHRNPVLLAHSAPLGAEQRASH